MGLSGKVATGSLLEGALIIYGWCAIALHIWFGGIDIELFSGATRVPTINYGTTFLGSARGARVRWFLKIYIVCIRGRRIGNPTAYVFSDFWVLLTNSPYRRKDYIFVIVIEPMYLWDFRVKKPFIQHKKSAQIPIHHFADIAKTSDPMVSRSNVSSMKTQGTNRSLYLYLNTNIPTTWMICFFFRMYMPIIILTIDYAIIYTFFGYLFFQARICKYVYTNSTAYNSSKRDHTDSGLTIHSSNQMIFTKRTTIWSEKTTLSWWMTLSDQYHASTP